MSGECLGLAVRAVISNNCRILGFGREKGLSSRLSKFTRDPTVYLRVEV